MFYQQLMRKFVFIIYESTFIESIRLFIFIDSNFSHVGNHIMVNCILNLLSAKLCFFVTNGIHYLPDVDQIIVFRRMYKKLICYNFVKI